MTVAKITTTGLNKKQDTGRASFLYLAVGTGSTTPAESDTALVAEVSRVALDSVVIGSQISWSAFFNSNQGNGNLNEWGIFDASASGNCLVRGLFASTVTKTNAEALIVTVNDTIANA